MLTVLTIAQHIEVFAKHGGPPLVAIEAPSRRQRAFAWVRSLRAQRLRNAGKAAWRIVLSAISFYPHWLRGH